VAEGEDDGDGAEACAVNGSMVSQPFRSPGRERVLGVFRQCWLRRGVEAVVVVEWRVNNAPDAMCSALGLAGVDRAAGAGAGDVTDSRVSTGAISMRTRRALWPGEASCAGCLRVRFGDGRWNERRKKRDRRGEVKLK
jgi:hypothetical protein